MKLLRILTIVAFAGGLANAQLPPAVPSGVPTFAGNAQHTGVFHAAATDLNVIRWSTTVDRRETFSNTQYGSPLVTAGNILILPVKTERDGFELKFFDARNGDALAIPVESDFLRMS